MTKIEDFGDLFGSKKVTTWSFFFSNEIFVVSYDVWDRLYLFPIMFNSSEVIITHRVIVFNVWLRHS